MKAIIKEKNILFVLFCAFLVPNTELHGQSQHYFYFGRHFGSESLINPISLILNGGYGILQMDNRPNNISKVDYQAGYENIKSNMQYPLESIRKFGWKKFILTEILPFSINRESAQYWPNYTEHLLGGGMSYRMMIEWFEYHHFSHAKIWSFTTMAVYHILNEIVENGSFRGYNVDPIADLYIFDPLSIILFSSDRIAAFFCQKLNFADWSFQLAYDPWDGTIRNNGQNYALKYRLGRQEKWYLFYHYGNHGELGLSYKMKDDKSISFGIGLTAKDLVNIKREENQHFRYLTADLVLNAGIFYDKDNSLMASLLYSQKKDNMVQLNIYPGVLKVGGISPGLFALIDRDKKMIIGIRFSCFPVGLAKNLH